MGRSIVKARAIVLRTRRMGETSKLVTLYSLEFGKLKVVAKGARRPKSKFGAAMELMTEVQVVCYLRHDRDLQTLSDADVRRVFPQVLGEMARLSYGSAACEMVDRLTIEHEPNQNLYQCLLGVLSGLDEVATQQVEPLFWYFQLRAAQALGYRPELGQCVSCGSLLGGAESVYFDAPLGGGLCAPCHRQAPPSGSGHSPFSDAWGAAEGADGAYGSAGRRRVGGESLRFLAALQELRTYQRDAIPASPPRVGEIRGMLRAFFECHGGPSGRLRALDFLNTVGRDYGPTS